MAPFFGERGISPGMKEKLPKYPGSFILDPETLACEFEGDPNYACVLTTDPRKKIYGIGQEGKKIVEHSNHQLIYVSKAQAPAEIFVSEEGKEPVRVGKIMFEE